MSIYSEIQSLSSMIKELRDNQDKIDQESSTRRSVDPLLTDKADKINNEIDKLSDLCRKKSQVKTLSKSVKNSLDLDAYIRNGSYGKTYSIKSSDYCGLTAHINDIQSSTSVIRKLSSPIRTSADLFEAAYANGSVNSQWTEGSTATTPSNVFTKKLIKVYDLVAAPQVTQRMIDDVEIDLESWVISRAMDSFDLMENDGFIKGNGTTQPMGILSYPISGAGSIRRARSMNASAITVDGLNGLYYSLPDQYSSNGAFIMHKTTVQAIRALKDANNMYVWSSGVLAGTADTLMGVPLYTCNAMPMIAANADVIIYGDIKKAYQIVDRDDILLQRDPFSAKPFITISLTKRTGGDVVLPDAISIMRIMA